MKSILKDASLGGFLAAKVEMEQKISRKTIIVLLFCTSFCWTHTAQAGFIKRWFFSDVKEEPSHASAPLQRSSKIRSSQTTNSNSKKASSSSGGGSSSGSSSGGGGSSSGGSSSGGGGSSTGGNPVSPRPRSSSSERILISTDTHQQCKGTTLPSFINNSVSWANCSNSNGFQAIYDGFKALSPPSIIVTSAGNHGGLGVKCHRHNNTCSQPSCPSNQSFQVNCGTGQVRCSNGRASCSNGQTLRLRCSGGGSITCSNGGTASIRCPQPVVPMKAKASRDYNAIIVGNLGTNGQRHHSSQQGPEVFIMAPSGSHLTTVGRNGHYSRFSGTSGAAPLVTGSLAGFEWLSNYHPTPAEAKKLLEKTAIPTLHSNENPRKNGVGMVNAYKLARVGKRLKEQCGQDIACFKRAINNSATYSWPADTGLLSAVDQAFPECSQSACASLVSQPAVCQNKAQVFKRLRKQALLNPSNKDLWKKIGCIYTNSGFWENGKSAFSIYRGLAGQYGQISQPKYCQRDSDCVLVPAYTSSTCGSSTGALKPMNKIMAEYLYAQCKGVTNQAQACNGKCRCGRNETVRGTGGRGTRYQVRCTNNLCRMSTSSVQIQGASLPILDGNALPTHNTEPSTASGSIQ